MKRKVRRPNHPGALHQAGRGIVVGLRWLARHPKPFALCVVLAGMGWALWGFVQRAEAFRVTHITLPPESALKLPPSILGLNIWSVDVRGLAQELKEQQPWLKAIRVARELPDTIRIEAIPRVPVAQLRGDRWYPVDAEGVVVPEAGPAPIEGLMQIVGCEHVRSLQVGKTVGDERVQLALRVLTRVRRAPATISRRVVEINVGDPQQLRFRITLGASPLAMAEGESLVEVRCGSEAELDAHLERLQGVLKVVTRQALPVAYIDVRFPEPVIGSPSR